MIVRLENVRGQAGTEICKLLETFQKGLDQRRQISVSMSDRFELEKKAHGFIEDWPEYTFTEKKTGKQWRFRLTGNIDLTDVPAIIDFQSICVDPSTGDVQISFEPFPGAGFDMKGKDLADFQKAAGFTRHIGNVGPLVRLFAELDPEDWFFLARLFGPKFGNPYLTAEDAQKARTILRAVLPAS